MFKVQYVEGNGGSYNLNMVICEKVVYDHKLTNAGHTLMFKIQPVNTLRLDTIYATYIKIDNEVIFGKI